MINCSCLNGDVTVVNVKIISSYKCRINLDVTMFRGGKKVFLPEPAKSWFIYERVMVVVVQRTPDVWVNVVVVVYYLSNSE